ncbi:uncharacterized protein UBRO_02946 [Ustilago bromivora]|uniref:Chromosome condensation protein (CrcB) n=1 Tax=Ustilago bromivora TaxID=307758 RepID=A0A1K0H2D2_9BASI|nr:uncharacterized protein UBRO_02946 [Ustilago bromivora]SYW84354.1 uncharacterized protein UBRO2_05454 [Ustilago bromivora]
MDSQTGPSRPSEPVTSPPRRSTDQRSAATPTLTHKTSMVSTTDTFASATDGEGEYTEAAADVSAFHADDAQSRFERVPQKIHAHVHERDDHTALSRSPSAQTAQRQHTATTDQLHATAWANGVVAPQESVGAQPASSSTSDSNTQQHSAVKEAGKQIERSHLPTPTLHRAMRHCAILGLLTFAAIWGTLAREGLVALNTYDGESVASLVWAQAVGCLIMGLAIGTNRQTIEGRYPPAYIMITTGFCGSVTTFSKWILDVFRAFGNQRHFDRHGLHNVMDALSQTGVTFGMAIVSVAAGVSLSRLVNLELLVAAYSSRTKSRPQLPQASQPQHAPTANKGKASKADPGNTIVLDASMFSLGILVWIASAILCALYASSRRVTFSLVLAPSGTILRWYLSRFNTHRISQRYSLPLGTLAANLFATAVICAAFTASRAGSVPRSFAGGLTGCEALLGLEDGFCGCLSTVSTFAVELRTIKPRRKAVRYAVISWVAGILLCVLLIGAPWWSIGTDGRCLGLTS